MNSTNPINLMLVEDERVVAFDLKNQLQSLGYHVGAMFGSGEQAVDSVTRIAPDLVLMDIHLDGVMDGVETASKIQALHKVPVIYLTAFAEDDTLCRALASRPFGYLVKPWDIRELHASIQMALARREVEVAVERSEHRLQLALDTARLGVFEWRPQTNQVLGDGRLCSLFGDGQMPTEEAWENLLGRVAPEDRNQVAATLKNALLSGERERVEFRTLRNKDEKRILEANLRLYPNGEYARPVIGVVQDVTDHRQAENRLLQASVVFQTSAEAIAIVNAKRRVSAVNPAFTRITGFDEYEALGFDIDLLLRTERPTLNNMEVFTALADDLESYWQGEVSCQRKDGEPFPAWQIISAVRSPADAVNSIVVAFSDVSSLHAAQEKFQHLAHHDPLTGLPNRLLLDDRIDQAIEFAHRAEQDCLLLFLDLDSFKLVNDTLGHSLGDQLLRTIANRLRENLRSADTIARLGGDEFIIFAGSSNRQYASELAQKILEVVCEPLILDGQRIAISGSIGIAVYPDNGSDRHQLMRAADIAMYSAKQAGRNCYRYYSLDMAEQSNERLLVEQGLRRSIEEDQLVTHYQPQVALADGEIFGVEALVRWQHPDHGMIQPTRFIQIAEESGVIHDLDRWVIERACRDLVGICDKAGQQLRLAVNVSAREFMREDFLSSVLDCLNRTGFPATALEIEITESTLQVMERSIQTVRSLKENGIAVSIDDFGTGYSSLSVLRDLPIDRIKIDRSFVQHLPEMQDGVAIVQAIIALADALHIDVIAEGVERPEQMLSLSQLGCGEGQGYLFSHPLPRNELLSLLANQRGLPSK